MSRSPGSRSSLDADEVGFTTGMAEIDSRLRGEIRQLQEHRRRIAKLAAGDSLALPPVVTTYLDRMRTLGVPEVLVEVERDSWVMIAAQWPEKMDEFMATKQAQLDDPLMQRLYRTLGDLVTGHDDSDARVAQAADMLAELAEQAAARGELEAQDEELSDDAFVDLLDTVVLAAGPRMVRLRDRLQELHGRAWLDRTGQAGARRTHRLAQQLSQCLGLLGARAAAGQVGPHGDVLVVRVGEGLLDVDVDPGEAVVAGQVGARVGQQASMISARRPRVGPVMGCSGRGWSGGGRSR